MAVSRDEEWSGVGRLSFLAVLLITASVVAAAAAPVGHRFEVARILLAGPWAGWSWPRVSMSFGVFTLASRGGRSRVDSSVFTSGYDARIPETLSGWAIIAACAGRRVVDRSPTH